MRAFVEARVKPYYLHHADLAPGTAHFRTSIAEGQALMRELRGRVSGLAQPTYVLDIPGGHGKVPIGPDYISAEAAPCSIPSARRTTTPTAAGCTLIPSSRTRCCIEFRISPASKPAAPDGPDFACPPRDDGAPHNKKGPLARPFLVSLPFGLCCSWKCFGQLAVLFGG